METVRGWYHRSAPDMGYVVERGRYGTYMHNASAPQVRRVTVDELDLSDVPELLAEARTYLGDAVIDLSVADRHTDARIQEALLEGGCERCAENVLLAHVGPPPKASPPDGLTVERVERANVETYARVRLRAFANGAEEPSTSRLAQEVALRTAELGGTGTFFVAGINGEPVAMIGWYEEARDRFVFQLGTDVPFRRLGIASHLLCAATAEAHAHSRPVLINADVGGAPFRLYHRLGFTDEVYWVREYRLHATPAP